MPTNTARSVLWPTDPRILARVCFLYVGQGSSILLLGRKDGTWHPALFDCNLDPKLGGIDVAALLKDLSEDGHLRLFANTHPHDDHLKGLKEIASALVVDEVWHSGHVPSKKYGTYHPDLTALIKDVEKRKGKSAVTELFGTRTETSFLDLQVHVLAPAEHVKDEVNEEEAERRYQRIHENCAVLRIGKSPSWLLVTGDADLVAFRDNITKYHKERLGAFLLDASHHGSRSFFMAKEGDDPYVDALSAIGPDYVVISAPTQKESPHDHPHDDAIALYEEHVGKGNVHHTGAERESFIFDIYEDGTHSAALTDNGILAEAYGLEAPEGDDGGNGGGGSGKAAATGPFVRPSGPGEFTPRKYG